MSDINKNLYNNILTIVTEFSQSEETYGDAAQLRINPDSLEAALIENPDEDIETFDYYDIGDLLRTNINGSFLPDLDAITEIASSY